MKTAYSGEVVWNGRLVDRIHAENVGCEYGEYD